MTNPWTDQEEKEYKILVSWIKKDYLSDLTDIKKIKKFLMWINLTTEMKWTNALKIPFLKMTKSETEALNVPISIK